MKIDTQELRALVESQYRRAIESIELIEAMGTPDATPELAIAEPEPKPKPVRKQSAKSVAAMHRLKPEKLLSVLNEMDGPFNVDAFAEAVGNGYTRKAAASQMTRWKSKGVITLVEFGKYRKTSNGSGHKVEVPGLDSPRRGRAELEALLQETIKERDTSKRNGRNTLTTILTDKVTKLQEEIKAIKA